MELSESNFFDLLNKSRLKDIDILKIIYATYYIINYNIIDKTHYTVYLLYNTLILYKKTTDNDDIYFAFEKMIKSINESQENMDKLKLIYKKIKKLLPSYNGN